MKKITRTFRRGLREILSHAEFGEIYVRAANSSVAVLCVVYFYYVLYAPRRCSRTPNFFCPRQHLERLHEWDECDDAPQQIFQATARHGPRITARARPRIACWDGNGPIRMLFQMFLPKRIPNVSWSYDHGRSMSLHTQCLDDCGGISERFGKCLGIVGGNSDIDTLSDPRHGSKNR